MWAFLVVVLMASVPTQTLFHPFGSEEQCREAREAVQASIVARIETGDASPEADHELCNLLRAGRLYWRMLENYVHHGDVEHHAAQEREKVA